MSVCCSCFTVYLCKSRKPPHPFRLSLHPFICTKKGYAETATVSVCLMGVLLCCCASDYSIELIQHKLGSCNKCIYTFELMDQQFKSAFKIIAGLVILAIPIFSLVITFSLTLYFILMRLIKNIIYFLKVWFSSSLF